MYTQEIVVNNEVGLHARPATFFIQKANEFKSGIWVERDDRRVNAARFQKEFYGGRGADSAEAVATGGTASTIQQAPASDPLQNLDAAAKQQLLLKLLAESPNMAALLTAFAGQST